MTCAKRPVDCWIIAESGDIFHGSNACQNPQAACPRVLGEGYEKCKTICQQAGHAEASALQSAGDHNLKGATAYISGHDYYCAECQQLLFAAGVKFLSRGKVIDGCVHEIS